MKTYVTPDLSVLFVENADVLTMSAIGAGNSDNVINVDIYGG